MTISKSLAGVGGSCANSTVRPYEAKHQTPKNTNTNCKESHLQMTDRENLVQTFQFMAAGEEWDAYEVDMAHKLVVRKHVVKAGPALMELIKTCYPKLDINSDSLAMRRDQGSSIAVNDADLAVGFDLSPDRVKLKQVIVRHKQTNKRPVKVDLVDDDYVRSGDHAWLHEGSVCVPQYALDLLNKYFSTTPVDEHWFTGNSLRAFRGMNVDTIGMPGAKQFELVCGSHIKAHIRG